MELKNANPNGCNAVTLNNLHPMIFFFKKYWILSKIRDFKLYLRIENL